jgi:CsoR family transcriptional regulator, copper-sensing transcriptional repressor
MILVPVVRRMIVCGFAHSEGARGTAGSIAVATYTMGGYIRAMRKDSKASCAKRLSRIEGQVRGIARMVDEDRYCIDIVTQISAVRAALRRLEEEVLRDHVAHCVEHAIASGNKADQRRKIEELMNVVGRADR